MKKFLLIPLALLILAGCTDPEEVKKAAKLYGWDSYRVTGYRWFACSEDDFYHTGFVAQKNGEEITGTICSGLFFKGATVRLD